jgi:sporulation protein YlmC with PRC-barrel domain
MPKAVAEVIAGPVQFLVAPYGTVLPAEDGTTITIDAAFIDMGYTEKGVDFDYQPTFQNFMVDEETAAVGASLKGEKLTVSANLAQTSVASIQPAIAVGTVTSVTADVTHQQIKKLALGGGSVAYSSVILKGTTPGVPTQNRYIIIPKAIATSNIKQTYQRAGQLYCPITLDGLTDTTRTAGDKLCSIIDVLAPHS